MAMAKITTKTTVAMRLTGSGKGNCPMIHHTNASTISRIKM